MVPPSFSFRPFPALSLSHLSPNDSPPSVAGSFLHPGSAGRLRAKTLSYRARERHKWKRRTTRPAEFPSERAKDGFQAMFQAISSDRNKRGRKRLLTGLALMNVRLSCPLFAVCPSLPANAQTRVSKERRRRRNRRCMRMFFSGPSLTPPVQVCVSLSLTLLACVSICKRDHSSLLREQRLAGDGGRVSPRRGE